MNWRLKRQAKAMGSEAAAILQVWLRHGIEGGEEKTQLMLICWKCHSSLNFSMNCSYNPQVFPQVIILITAVCVNCKQRSSTCVTRCTLWSKLTLVSENHFWAYPIFPEPKGASLQPHRTQTSRLLLAGAPVKMTEEPLRGHYIYTIAFHL